MGKVVHSTRFNLPVVLTEHAKARMLERDIGEALVLELIESGTEKDAGNGHYWFYKRFGNRSDNLLCAAAVVDNVIVVKTIMHHWEATP